MIQFSPEEYPRFTPEMRKTHTILMPQMCPIHFQMIQRVMEQSGYRVELLKNQGPDVVQEGLKYVHNDTCYPALLVIGQMIDALNSGRYDLERTALVITQTGGGCRASNYIHLLRKALKKAGYGQIPVASLNFSGLEKDSGVQLTLPLLRQLLGCVLYGDMLMLLQNQVRPYENHPGDADRLTGRWVDSLSKSIPQGAFKRREMKRLMTQIADEFAAIPMTWSPKVKVGVVGEIYVKYSPLGNNNLEEFLHQEDCEVNMPGLLGFMLYSIYNTVETIALYGGSAAQKKVYSALGGYICSLEEIMIDAMKRHAAFTPPHPFAHTMELGRKVISLGNKMGEGWLLTSEMMELADSGYENIICTQPFGCLPNHICGKGMVSKIRDIYPQANIVPIDYDPGATKVNQENRIKLMLSVAREQLAGRRSPSAAPEAAPQSAKESPAKQLLHVNS